jgi:sugar lactone lactonase YvrE
MARYHILTRWHLCLHRRYRCSERTKGSELRPAFYHVSPRLTTLIVTPLIDSYRFTVNKDGSWGSRQTFAFVDVGFPDGIHCDTKGYVYAGCGDGVHVWNPAGQLIGKIYLGTPSANFQFAGQGRMVICAETELYYVTLGAKGAEITDYDYSQVS